MCAFNMISVSIHVRTGSWSCWYTIKPNFSSVYLYLHLFSAQRQYEMYTFYTKYIIAVFWTRQIPTTMST